MSTFEIIALVLMSVVALLALVIGIKIFFFNTSISELKFSDVEHLLDDVQQHLSSEMKHVSERSELTYQLLLTAVRDQLANIRESNDKLIGDVRVSSDKKVDELRIMMNERLQELRMTTERKVEDLRVLMSERLNDIRTNNEQKIDAINQLVNEKLTETLSKRLNESFASLNDNFTRVQQELGKMQSLAEDVTGLRNVLTASKTRGLFGEVQLDRILSDYLLPTQYRTNVEIKPRSGERVEFAVILPGNGDIEMLLPIDAKFPMVSYENMLTATENGDNEAAKKYSTELHAAFKKFAKDIHDKYIDAPTTTDYAIMFLPTESIFIEALKNGTAELIRTDYHVVIAGPSNMAVILNSLQMGFKTVQMQKTAGEVWRVLAMVKTEFATFASALEDTQKSIHKAGDNLDKLVGTRTRKMNQTLKQVEKGIALVDAEKTPIILTIEPEDSND